MANLIFGGHKIGSSSLQFSAARGVFSEVDNTTQSVGASDGEMLVRSHLKSRIIPVTYDFVALSRREFERQLAPLLYSTDVQKLIIDDRPDEFWYAKVDGKIDMDRAYFLGTGTINFLVPDGIAHSVATKTADNINDDTLSDTITVHNGGTYPAYPVIEATMHSDNGVVTLINENNGGIIQLGNPGEVDGVQAPNSETVFHYDLLSAPSGVTVNTGTINYPTYPYGSNPGPNTIAGSWDYAKAPDAATPVLNRTAAMHWAGPTFHGPIKANAAGVNTGNLIWSNRFNVVTSVGALGRVEFNLQSGDDIAVCFVMRDSTYAADMLTVEGWVNGHNVFVKDLNRNQFTNGFYEIVESKLGNTTTFKLTRIKQLSASGIISSAQTLFPPVTIDGMADKAIDSFTVWMAGFSDKTGWTINWSDSVFQWVNVDYWKDLPNRFADGDVLLIDPSQIKVFVNNVEDRTLHAIDNDWEKFRLDPGDTSIKLVCSDFATTPSVAITLREAFL
ncbi:distal tail protein Dit [Lacticaseibacillus paracasei]|uniref:distal tail protein Dit n=1 Tax=Lacticaseibacillus paracasei TaxID=1597 RepID=UPI0021A661E4|nr:distal tail protein Dit [Lacticaseibacillus paracasei]MCT4386392.1 phage tail protein [Lacticaseibacillus paracasei]